MELTRATNREINNADSNHDGHSPATTRSESRTPSWTPSTESSRPQRENRRDRHVRLSKSRGQMDDAGATAANAVGEPMTPQGITPVAAVAYVTSGTNAPLGATPATKGVGPATTAKGAGEHGSLHALAEETRGRDFTTPGAASATGKSHPATNEAVHTLHNAKVTPRRHPNGTDAYPHEGLRQEQERTGGLRGAFTASEEPTTASIIPSCLPGRTSVEPAHFVASTPPAHPWGGARNEPTPLMSPHEAGRHGRMCVEAPKPSINCISVS